MLYPAIGEFKGLDAFHLGQRRDPAFEIRIQILLE